MQYIFWQFTLATWIGGPLFNNDKTIKKKKDKKNQRPG